MENIDTEELYRGKQLIRQIVLLAVLIRLVCLGIMLFMSSSIEPYFITDDVSFEEHAITYIQNARGIIDVPLFRTISNVSLDYPLWSWVVCISAYITKSIFASRFINIALSVASVVWIYKLTLNVSEDVDTSLKAARLYAYLPLPVLLSCFCIKDIYLTFACLTFFNVLLKIEKHQDFTIKEILLEILLAIGVHFTRGAVVELFLIFLAIYWMRKVIASRNYQYIFIAIIGVVLGFFMLRTFIVASFSEKLFYYGNVDGEIYTLSSYIRKLVNEVLTIPYHYVIATISPISLSVFGWNEELHFWLNLLSILNLSIIPVALGNVIYIFKRKANLSFWVHSLVMYCAVVILSFGIFRHFLFLLPIEIINYSCYSGSKARGNKTLVLGLFAIYSVILLYSLFSLL